MVDEGTQKQSDVGPLETAAVYLRGMHCLTARAIFCSRAGLPCAWCWTWEIGTAACSELIRRIGRSKQPHYRDLAPMHIPQIFPFVVFQAGGREGNGSESISCPPQMCADEHARPKADTPTTEENLQASQGNSLEAAHTATRLHTNWGTEDLRMTTGSLNQDVAYAVRQLRRPSASPSLLCLRWLWALART